jgi:hypothetical protein
MARSPGIYPWDSGRRIPSPPRTEVRGYVPAPTRGEMREHQVGAVLRRLPPTREGASPGKPLPYFELGLVTNKCLTE